MPTQETVYTQYPDASIDSRPRYFHGQYLASQDFVDEQRYHVDRLRRALGHLRISGVLSGLEVTPAAPLKVDVAAGTAIDHAGRQLILSAARAYTFADATPRNASYVLALRYAEPTDRTQGGTDSEPGTHGDTRFHEDPSFQLYQYGAPLTTGDVALAMLTLDAGGVVTVFTPATVRVYSGLRLPGKNGPTLTTGGDAAPDLVHLGGSLHISGSLTVDGTLRVLGALTPSVGTDAVGIVFPSDPAGGYGDGAWITYSVAQGEATTLQIGIGNDPDDTLRLHQQGGDRLIVQNGQVTIAGAAHAHPTARLLNVQDELKIFGAAAGLRLADRADNGADDWVVYGAHGDLHFWRGTNIMDLTGAGDLGVTGALHVVKKLTVTGIDGAAVSGPLDVDGAARLGHGLTVQVPGASGWDRVVVDVRTDWDGKTQVATLGGDSGVFLRNPYVPWHAAEERASIRYGRAGSLLTGAYWDAGTRGDGSFAVRRFERVGDADVDRGAYGTFHHDRDMPTLTLGSAAQSSASAQLRSAGHLHIMAENLLYLLPKKGVVIGSEWGGNGNLQVEGAASVGNGLTVASGLNVHGGATLADGVTISQGATVAGGLTVTGATTTADLTAVGTTTLRSGSLPGWDRIIIGTTNTWDAQSQAIALGGATGFYLRKPRVPYDADNKRAAIAYGRAGGTLSGAWWEAGVNAGGAFALRQTSGAVNNAETDNGELVTFANTESTAVLTLGNDKVKTSRIRSPGRMHLDGDELLYLLHKQGVVVGKEWGGTGDLGVEGQVNVGDGTSGTLKLGAWKLVADGHNLRLLCGDSLVAKFSIDFDRLAIFRDANGQAPYWYFNKNGEFSRWG